MSPDEIRRLVEIAQSLGARTVKITGGEPLLRDDICQIVSGIRQVSGIKEISLTTNGALLSDRAKDLREAGLNRVNIGIISLDPTVYRKVTGRDYVEEAKKGLDRAEKAGLTPIKINMVVLRSINDHQVWDTIEYIKGRNLTLQLIELENTGKLSPDFYSRHFVDLHTVEEQLMSVAVDVAVRSLHNRKIYYLNGNGARVELVRPFHNSAFCANCTRLRLTATGKLKPCLMRQDNHLDALTLLREGASDERLRQLFREVNNMREPYFRGVTSN
jgi:cyclic pyranopterin phosphate synthase